MMKKRISSTGWALAMVLQISRLFAQLPDGIFLNEVYPGYNLTSNISYGGNTNYFTGQFENLLLDLYEPVTDDDYRRPLLIYAHGGGFTGGDKTKDKAIAFADYFTKRGYVVASINYRLGDDITGTTDDNFQTVYMGAQDSRAAIRFFHRYADDYCLDTAAIFMSGSSAGATLALVAAYWDQEEADKVVPDIAAFGPIDASSGNEGYSDALTAIVVCWGGLTDTSWMKGETEPQQLFHGTEDSTIPYTEGYNSDSVYLYGGYMIHQAALMYGIESYLKTYEGVGHGISEESPKFDTMMYIADTFMYSHLPDNIGQASCKASSLQLYPNPSDGRITAFNSSESISFGGTFTVFDAMGRVVFTDDIIIPAAGSMLFNLPGLANGLYLFRFQDDTKSNTYKMIISSP